MHRHIHTYPRTPPPTKILIIMQLLKICNRFSKKSIYIKVYFCFENFFGKKNKLVTILDFVTNMLFHN